MQNNTNWLQFEIKQEAINSRQFAELNVNDTLFEKKIIYLHIYQHQSSLVAWEV